MKRWRASAAVTISIHTDVEAETEEEAKAIVEERSLMRLCHYCSSRPPSVTWVTSGELDGEPKEISIELEEL